MSAFEVFSNGVRTRTVMRNDFIGDYASIEAETSIGPFYTVGWRIEPYPSENTLIRIHTDEGSPFFFDLETAESASVSQAPASPIETAEFIPAPPTPASPIEAAEVPPDSRAPALPVVVFIIAGFSIIFVGAGMFFLARHKRAQ